MTVEPTWALLACLLALLALTVAVSLWARLGTAKDGVVAALRAALQLAVVSTLIVAAISHLAWSLLLVLVMFAIAVWTTAGRTGTRHVIGWVALAMAAGIVPVLAVVFLSGTMPLNGLALVPIAGIVIGNMMSGHTLVGRRIFAALRDEHPTYEAGLSIGLTRSDAIALVIDPLRAEALIPNIDQTKSTGLVTLPGAFIGVLLGGGSPFQAAAAQVLVLLGIMCGQTVTVVVAAMLMRAGKLLPDDLRASLRP